MTGFELYLGEGANPSTFEFLQSINSDNDYGDGNWQVPLSLPAGQYTLEARGASIHPDSTFQDTSSSTFTVIAPDPNSIDTTYDAHGRVESRIRTWYDPQVEFMPVAVEHHGKREWMARGPDMDADYGSFQGIGGLEAIIDEATGKTTPIIDTVHGHVIATIDLGDPANSTDDVIQYKKQQFGGYGPLPGSTQQPLEVTEDLTASLGWQTRCIDPTRFFAMGARHYDPLSGRFLSADPLGHSATPDLYSYAGGDPINFLDPTGRQGIMSLPIIDPVQASQNMNALGEGLANAYNFVIDNTIGNISEIGLPGIGGSSAQSVYSDIANNTIEPAAELALLTGITAGAGSYLQISNAAIKAPLVFSLTGGAAEVSGNFMGDLISGESSSFSDYANSFTGGTVGGLTTYYTRSPSVGGGISEFVAGLLNGDSAGNIAFDTALGASSGYFSSFIKVDIPGLNTGRNSFEAITKSTLTKIGNGTIPNFSNKTASKMFVSNLYGDLYSEGFESVVKYLKNQHILDSNASAFEVVDPVGKFAPKP